MNEMVENFWIFKQKGSNIVNLLQDIIVNDNHITTMGTHNILAFYPPIFLVTGSPYRLVEVKVCVRYTFASLDSCSSTQNYQTQVHQDDIYHRRSDRAFVLFQSYIPYLQNVVCSHGSDVIIIHNDILK
jgi:hypothetical protein